MAQKAARYFLCIVMCAVGVELAAQGIVLSDEINLKNDYTYEFVGVFQGNLLMMRDRAFSYEVSAFDERMRLRWERELDFGRRRVDLIGSSFQDSFFHVFYSFRDRDERMLQVNRYDANAFLKSTDTIVVDGQLSAAARWRFAKSENQRRVVLFGPAERKEVRFICYDAPARQLLWDVTVPFADSLAGKDFKDLIVSDAGEMFLVLENFSGGLMRSEYHQEVWRFHGRLEMPERLDLRLNERVAHDSRYVYDNRNDQLVGVSLIGSKDNSPSDALLIARLERGEHSFNAQHIDHFEEAMLQELYGRESRVPRGLTSFFVRDLALREDGGVVIFLETIREYSRKPAYPYTNIRNDNPLNFRRWVDYYHEDVLAFSYAPDLSRDWSVILRKRQYSQDDDGVFSSYYLFRTPSFLHVVYNDEIRNENTVSEYVLNGDGEFVRNSLLSTASQRLKLRFRDAIQTSANSFVVPSERANRLMLVKFVY